MKSKIRTITMVVYFLTIFLFGLVSIGSLIQSTDFFDSNFNLGIITGLILVVFIYFLIRYLLIVEIQFKENKIIFFRPLLLKKTEFHFSKIIGYNFSELRAESHQYMMLKIITKDDFYYFSDFETENFHEIENEIIRQFTLCKKGTFEKENDEQKSIEINNRKKAKERQNKDIKDIIKMSKFLSLFMVFMSILDYYIHQTINTGKIFFFTTSILFVWYTFYKSNEISKKSK